MVPNFQINFWRISLLFSLFISISAAAYPCCIGDPHTLSELLLHDESNRKIFQCQVLESFVETSGLCFSRARVQQVFKGNVDSADVWIATGEINSSVGCHPLNPGDYWLIYSTERKPGWFGAGTICDRFSTPANRYESSLSIVTDFRDKTAARYSGPIRWYNKDGTPLAEGQMRRGKATGTWKHYNWEGKLVSTASYQKGLLHGERVRTHPVYGHRETCQFQKGNLISRAIINNG